ncbi:MAG TPA: hypothetical protein HA326_07080 [Thermoplasmata archaeon]|nr:hypothetical protein [Thermoplasmata archaeon]
MGRRNAGAQRQLVRALLAQKTYPELLNLNIGDPEDWFPWFVASSLFAKPISAAAARTTALLLFKEEVASPEAIERCGWDGLVTLLDLGGYVRYDFSTATKLLAIAAALRGERLRGILTNAGSAADVERELTRIKGVGPKTVAIFLRELRGAGGPPIPVSDEARAAAKRLRLNLKEMHAKGRELSRLESVLVRTWVEHCKRGRWQTCPAGTICGCAPANPTDPP